MNSDESEIIEPAAEPTVDRRFRKKDRLRRQLDFSQAYAQGIRCWNRGLTVCVCSNTEGMSRLGLSISKRVGSSPVRNRWKRLLREVFRLHRESIPLGYDFIVIVRPGTKLIPFHELKKLVPDLMARSARKQKNRNKANGSGHANDIEK